MYRDNHEDDPRDERCLPHSGADDGKPVHPWADAVDERCRAICEDGSCRLHYSVEDPARRPDPIPSDWLEKGAHYDPEGSLIIPEGIYNDPIIPAEDDDF